MSFASILLAALGLGILMVVHEGGHYLVARHFGMRVVKFSIGFGPTLWRHQPKGSPTVYQIAIIPFLAYVQIAGMNPYEEHDPNDAGSYANASLVGRIATIFAGPLANYLFASVLFFGGVWIGGNIIDDMTMRVSVHENGPAFVAGMRSGDRVVRVNGEAIDDWEGLPRAISSHAGETITVDVEREKQSLSFRVTPEADGKDKGKILIGPEIVPFTLGRGAVYALKKPPHVVQQLVTAVSRMITFRMKPQLSGPVGIVKETARAVQDGADSALWFLGLLSAYLGGFNLLPFPALDGGRLLFLGYEAISRRKADAKIEAKIHAVGLLMMLTLIAIVTYSDLMPKK